MSGPITAGFVLVHGLLVLSARALQEARAMKREYGDVLAQLAERDRQQAQARSGQRSARLERIAAIRGEGERQAARLDRLRALAQAMSAQAPDIAAKIPATVPAAPAGDDDAAWGAHLRALDAAIRELTALLGQAGGAVGERVRASLAATASAPVIDEVLASYVLQRQLKPGLDAGEAERFRQTAARVLARLELPAGAALPAELEALAKAIVLAPTLERAEALATELRLAVQRQRDARDAQRREIADANRLLDELPEDAPAVLVRALELVAAGVARMDPPLRAAAEAALATTAADREREEQEAAALVLQESLRDLGYDVDDIEATLFADGGAVHFRRRGWENYFVRMRVDVRERTANFNVVRARGDEETAERRRLDALAEDRWCAEFPRLMATLEARGLTLDVRRRLEAGEVPVQVVDGDQLPAIAADEDATRPRAAPRARDLP
ncbi:MAG: hypothetical protein IPM22_10250 [Betaproteobacteria bacterium]|nr:hypothetical protein [Betaproteobacteria bacterium]